MKKFIIIIVSIIVLVACYFSGNFMCDRRNEDIAFGGAVGDIVCGKLQLETEDDYVNFLIQTIADDQADYIKTHNKYWGGRKASEGKWDKANFSLPTGMPFSVNVLHHRKPSTGETGYVIILEKIIEEREYKRSVGYGVAEKPLSDWVEIIEPDYHNL